MRKFLIPALFFLLVGCGGKKAAVDSPENNLDEPDRILFDRAQTGLEKHRLTVARLTLQTLINTYPDSEYLPQAKYALAESYYRESTKTGFNQAETEFKDYITFFPTSDLADDAQLMVAMTHVRQMEKADRDRTQALLAEAELKSMIEDYPDSPLLDEAKQKLREVQEVLAEGVYKIASFYFLRKSFPAAADRYREALTKYPDYSRSSDALFYLAESLRRNNNEPESAIYYARIVSDHPLSERAGDARQRLTAMNAPIPQPNPVALARAQQTREDKGIFGKVFGMFNRRPPVTTDTDAATSSQDGSGQPTENNKGGSGTFSIDPAVVQPEKPPATNPR